jgi:hypothetical protein
MHEVTRVSKNDGMYRPYTLALCFNSIELNIKAGRQHLNVTQSCSHKHNLYPIYNLNLNISRHFAGLISDSFPIASAPNLCVCLLFLRIHISNPS